MKRPKWMRSGTAALILLVIGVVFIGVCKSLANYVLEQDMVRRDGLRNDLQHVFVAMGDEETSVRGYVSTGQPVFLQPYSNARRLIPGYFSTLRDNSDPVLRDDALAMRALHDRWVREVAAPLIAMPHRPDALRIALHGKVLMDEIRSRAGDFRRSIESGVARDIRLDFYADLVALTLVILVVVAFGSLSLRLERKRLRAERELRLQVAQRNLELERSNQALAEFAYVASHDLQEPLRTVASFTQLLARRYVGKLDAQADEFIGYAVDGALRMQALIDDILEYSRVTTHGTELVAVDLKDVVAEVLPNLRTSIAERDAQVEIGDLPVVHGDRRQLDQLFQNLIANALKYNRAQPPRVCVVAHRRNDGWWQIAVSDNGIGIAKEYHERIFRIFARLHAREEYSGTGIGLSICKRIVDRHGGQMWVDSEEGQGAKFSFTLAPVEPESP